MLCLWLCNFLMANMAPGIPMTTAQIATRTPNMIGVFHVLGALAKEVSGSALVFDIAVAILLQCGAVFENYIH